MLFCTVFGLPAVGADSANVAALTKKVRVTDRRLGADIQANGATLLADYASFSLYQVSNGMFNKFRQQNGIEEVREGTLIRLNTGALDTSLPAIAALRKPVDYRSGKRLHLIQFIGPVKPEWRAALEQLGLRIVSYIPQNAFLIFGTGSQLQALEAWAANRPEVQWEGAYQDSYKIHPRARTRDTKGQPQDIGTDEFIIQMLADDELNPATLKLLDRLKLAPIRRQWKSLNYLNIVARIPAELLPNVAAQPEVISIQPYLPHVKSDERQDQILAGNLSVDQPVAPGYLAWLSSKGFSQSQFDTSGFVIDLSDSGIDNGTTLPGHFGLYTSSDTNLPSRVVYNRLVGTSNLDSTLAGCDGHGTLNAHIISGFNDEASSYPHADPQGYHYGLGVCPFVKIGSSVVFDPHLWTSPDFTTLQSQAYNDGARISNNSWVVNNSQGAYGPEAQTFDALVRDAQPDGAPYPADGNQEMVIVFAAGNYGPGAQTVCNPGTAKNVLTVGASENVRSLLPEDGGNNGAGQDGCGLGAGSANSANDIASFSGRGPCADGRSKPDLVAPGTHVTGGVGQSSPAPGADTLGSAMDCFDGSDVCALPGGGSAGSSNNFFPMGQQFYTISSGTSQAAPAVSGAAALVRQYFINQGSNAPSPAMTKAYLINSTRYLTGDGANDSLWSTSQGMGELNLGMAFDGAARITDDQATAEKFTASGQSRTFTGRISDPSKPFRITLAWSDAPGSTTGAAYNNDLDLVVEAGGQTYKGNVFSGAYSTTGGSADQQNNVESVFLPAGISGNFLVTVSAANINSDGVPNEAPDMDQDFALVIYNGLESPLPVVLPDGADVLFESCAPTNGVVDAGETVTMSFGLRNAGSGDTTNLTATLLASSTIRNPSGSENYGTLTTAGETVAQAFSFQAAAGCGLVIHPTFHLQDGTNDLGTVSFSIRLGTGTNVLAENFDEVTAPDLPLGWGTAAIGSVSPWTTDSSTANSSTNSAYVPDAFAAGVSELESPAFQINSPAAQLSFAQSYSFEAGYDGGVLEIKIGTNDYADVVAAGGSFETGGYNSSLATGDSSNPLHNRAAWSGESGGFITTVVDLPAAAAGQTVQLKWRCGTDSDNGANGWHVDDIVLTDYECCGNLAPGQAAFSASPLLSGPPPVTVTFNDTSAGSITNRFWDFGNGLTTNTTATNFTFVYTNAGTNTVILSVDGPAGGSTLTRTNYIVVTNLMPVLRANGFALVAELCTNNAVDPSETATANFTLQNVGGGPTTNLVATLLATNGISAPSGPQTYGAIASGASAANPFTFTAIGNCGDTIVATLQLQDGAADLGTIPFVLTLGAASSSLEDFESVSAPALPPGWNTSATGAQVPWVTTNDAATSGSLSAFAADPADIGVSELDSPVFNAPVQAQLSFNHAFNLESYSPGTGQDGGVLELAIDGGAFNDILAAGGTFVSGGYNCTLDGSTGNPLGGRQAWSGDSGGFIITTITLPPTAWGKPVQFRWLCGSDESNAWAGWHVDDVTLSGISCCYNPPMITTQPQNQAVWPGQSANFFVSATGTPPLTYQWRFNGVEIADATDTNYIIAAAQTNDAGTYDVVISNIAATITSSPALLTLLMQPLLVSPQTTSNGEFTFLLNGNAGFNYLIETTTNLSNWSTVDTLSNATGEVLFTDTNDIATPFRAYRARLLP